MTGGPEPSPWVTTWAPVIVPGGRVLDLACGSGRHARWMAARGHPVLAVDRDEAALRSLTGVEGVATRGCDLEAGEWPLEGELFDALVVTNYLHRALWSSLLHCLRPRGVLIYETFAHGNARYGRPASPDFLLAPGELLRELGARLHVIAYEDRFVEQPKLAMVQRICAARVTDSNEVWR